MSGNEGEGGGGGGEEGGFLHGGWETAMKWAENIGGYAGDAQTGLDVANRLSGALPIAQGLSQFAGGGMGGLWNVIKSNPTELWNAGSEAAEAGGGFLGGASKVMGPLGVGMGAFSAARNGVEMANDISKEGWDNGKGGGAYHDANFYNHAGGAALGAAHTILPFLGPYGKAADLGLSVGELGANYGGKAAGWAFGDQAKFSADSVAGGLIRGTFGDQSLGEQARQGIGNVFGHGTAANIAGWGADIATNSAMFLPQLGATVGRGLWNEGSAIVDGIANGRGAIGGALNHAGHAVADGASAAWDWTKGAASSAGSAIANGASSAYNWAGNAASTAGNAISNAGSSALNWAGNTASSAGHAISSGASSLVHGAGSVISSVASW
jgi:hypothetical protein